MSNVLKMAAVGGAVSAETDPNFKQTVLLLHGDGTNGAQNNTFLDSSSNNFTITRNPTNGPNAPTQGTFSPFSLAAGEWSNFFDGTTDMLSLPSNAAFQYGTGDYTYEFWVYHTNLSGQQTYFSRNASGNFSGVYIYKDTSNFVGVYYSSQIATSSVTINANQWYHIVVSRLSGTLRIFIDGVQRASVSDTTNLTESIVRIGADGSTATAGFAGYMSNARILKGVGYSSVTVPTTPLTNITNTSLLTCQSNRFVDNGTANSGTGFAITRNGDVRVTPFSPFAPSAAYDPAVNGGSGYFDGSGDYLTVPDNAAFDLGTSDFTIEGWVYVTATSGSLQTFLAKGTGADNQASYDIALDGSTWKYYLSGNGSTWSIASGVSMGASAGINTWQHLALVRNGNTFTPYVNGVAGTTTSSSAALFDGNKVLSLGADDTGAARLTGYISGARVVKGTALTITVPTAPPTPITNTSLLCNFTNAGIFDNTGKNNLETVGNAQIDTGTKKFGTGSMEFDGTGDRLIIPPTQDLDLTTGDFTVEAWIYTNTIAAGVAVFAYRGSTAVTLSTDIQWSMYRNGSSLIVRPYFSTTDYTINIGTIAANTWYHVAFTRSGSTFRGFLNGTVSATTQTISGSLNNNATWSGSIIGSMTEGGVDRGFNGFIDDLRITKGVARYPTEPFPTKAFPDL